MLFLASLLSLVASAEIHPQLAASETFSPPHTVNYRAADASHAALLPQASNAWFLFFGAPEISLGYRQGFGSVELQTRASFDYFNTAAAAETMLKWRLIQTQAFTLAPSFALGLAGNFGARHFYQHNFKYFALQPQLGLWLSFALSNNFSFLGVAELPFLIPLTSKAFGFKPTAGVGASFTLGNQLNAMVLVGLGPHWLKPPEGPTSRYFAWFFRFGFGFNIS